MQVILHAGAHRTDDDKLLKSLFKNQEDVRGQGVALLTAAERLSDNEPERPQEIL